VRRRHKTKIVAANPDFCHICGIIIPKTIASALHPLAPTIDHVISKINGGKDYWENRKMAHRSCNQLKGPRTGLSCDTEINLQRKLIVEAVRKLGLKIGPVHIRLARERSSPPTGELLASHRAAIQAKQRALLAKRPEMADWMRWCDDGGFCKE
jgi:hypothetical protein